MLGRDRIDPLTRGLVLGTAAGRLVIGSTALLATGPALRLAGFGEPGASGRGFAKVLGARDLAIGLLILFSRDDRASLRTAVLAAAALDAGDTVGFAFVAAEPETRRAGLLSVVTAAGAALGGFWTAHRLG